MQAQDVMVRGVISVGPEMPVQAAAHAMVSNGISALLVMDINAKLVGIVSEGDLIRRVETHTERRRSRWIEMFVSNETLAREFVKSHARRVADVMTTEVVTAGPHAPLREIANLMEKHGIKRVPIVEHDKVIGIVTRANLLQALASAKDDTEWAESDRVLRERIIDSMKGMPWASRPFNIVVSERRADLWGFVFSESEKAAVRVAAESTPGIDSVKDHLRILPYVSGI
jgi:CBS domain-containing protein